MTDEQPVWIIGPERRKADHVFYIPAKCGTAIRDGVYPGMWWEPPGDSDEPIFVAFRDWRRLMGRRKSDWEER